ncbi:MAG: acetylxylan esterase [Bacteroidales bacterium]|nr:acetylxylan esterase [Bacteroidales bacterium]
MKSILRYSLLQAAVLVALLTASCRPGIETPTGVSEPDFGWLFLGRGPYTLDTKVEAAPGPAFLALVTDRSLMASEPEILLEREAVVAPDSTLHVKLGNLEPGFYQVRLNDTVRFNIGVRPDAVVSVPDAKPDFDAFWESTLSDLALVPLEPEFTEIPEFSNEKRICYEVRYASWGGQMSGGILSVPVAEGRYPVYIQYMGYGAPVFRFDPSADPGRIDFLVSVRDQGIFKEGHERWIDRGLSSKDDFYYRGAFADARRAVDFVVTLPKADPERLVAFGESQGGALTFVAAALDSRIKAIAPAVPFLGDYPDYARIVWWPVHEVFEQADEEGIDRNELFDMLSYFDVKNFAPKVHCPVYMAFGLQDPTCPPHTNFAIYNNLGTTQKKYYCVPDCGHAMWQVPAWERERSAFLTSEIASIGKVE